MSTEAVRFSHPFVSRLALMVLSRGLSARNCAIEVLAIGVPTGSAPSSATGGSRPMLYNTARVNAVARVAGYFKRAKTDNGPRGKCVTRKARVPYSYTVYSALDLP